MEPSSALVIGAAAATACYFAKYIQSWLKIDDTLEVWRAHGVGGMTGALLVGVLASFNINKVAASSHQLGIQALAVVIVAAYAWVLTALVLKVLDLTGTLRVPQNMPEVGLDHAWNMTKKIAE